MSARLYPAGNDYWRTDWPTLDLRWMLVTPAYGFSPYADTVADLVSGEITVAGYARQPLAGAMREARDDVPLLQAWDYMASSPSWTGLAAGEDVGGLVLFVAGADDDSSVPLAHWDLMPTVATAAGDLAFQFPSGLPWHPGLPADTAIIQVYAVQ